MHLHVPFSGISDCKRCECTVALGERAKMWVPSFDGFALSDCPLSFVSTPGYPIIFTQIGKASLFQFMLAALKIGHHWHAEWVRIAHVLYAVTFPLLLGGGSACWFRVFTSALES